ncbi:carbohydrate binding domain-containing protein [Paenibacillus donghaensis]|uniref:CBM-cenC domain-containing protein n=1 Tax=Paenibacillus donghaensis TaxID=414771 RepID=A0A2Z2K5V8_9BACL|nr:carbohydrate binding domain-containing protein [Paenibacillus donghaensis]ASA20024.1 hypothetical protein B9T62_03950 [Paenibacillus donghaensis]
MRIRQWFIALLAVVVITGSVLPAPMAAGAGEVTTERILVSNFEDGTAQGWTAKGSEVVTVSGSVYRSGSHSLYISGRTQDWEGPNYGFASTLAANSSYAVRAWVKLDAGASAADIKLTMMSVQGGILPLFDAYR